MATVKLMKLPKPRIQPLQKGELTTEQLDLINQMGPHASNTNVFRTLIRHQKSFQRKLPFDIYIQQESTLPPRDKELLILRIGWLCQAEYEWAHHAIRGKQTGLTDQEILRISKGPEAEGWSVFDAALLKAVDELHKDAFISDSTWVALSERYTEQQIMDLIFTVGQYNMISMILNSFGIQLEESYSSGSPK
jgi:4-carboxymuconolactone decarboxylase